MWIIGGGASLRSFPFDSLEGECVIGINDAFRLGSRIVALCLFGDASWYYKVKDELETFAGRKVSCAPAMQHFSLPDILWMGRVRDGLGGAGLLGWNYSTGAAAIDLAVQMGAGTVLLLGFDLQLLQGKSHWHNHRAQVTSTLCFDRFLRGFERLAADLKRYRSDVQVYNVTQEGSSRLTCWPRLGWEEALQRVRRCEEKVA